MTVIEFVRYFCTALVGGIFIGVVAACAAIGLFNKNHPDA